jgi:hypothetical protein
MIGSQLEQSKTKRFYAQFTPPGSVCILLFTYYSREGTEPAVTNVQPHVFLATEEYFTSFHYSIRHNV